MKVIIIGSGNTATVLGRRIKDAGHEILQVFSRNALNAEDLAITLDCEWVNQWKDIREEEAIYLVALTDQAISTIAQHWKTEKGLVVHTAGSLSKEILKGVSNQYGVIYPLQSLRKEKIDYDSIPLLTDGDSVVSLKLITEFAESISYTVRHAGNDERLRLHLAAVVVNNFTNHLYSLASDYCEKNHLAFELLQPLILETAERLAEFPPSMVQTGPAMRGDEATMIRHLQLLADSPDLLNLYGAFSKSIKEKYRMVIAR